MRRLQLRKEDACRCDPAHDTGRSYFGHRLCLCGGLIVSQRRREILTMDAINRLAAAFRYGRGLPRIAHRNPRVRP